MYLARPVPSAVVSRGRQVGRAPISSASFHVNRLQRVAFAQARPIARGRSAATVVMVAETSDQKERKRPGENKGFIEEMRFVAMKLHTPQQAKEGEKKEKAPEERPMPQWNPSKEGYLKYLIESNKVYSTMESIMASGSQPSYAKFIGTGLERTEGLAKDIAWFHEQGVTVEATTEGPGDEYSKFLTDLSVSDPPAFICHYYNVYFAHSAGGRMIGRKMSEMLLDGAELEFYKWDGELSDLLQGVKDSINEVAEEWTREQKDHCLEETEKSFKLSGSLMRLIAS